MTRSSISSVTRLLAPLSIGSITLPNRLILAPMAGVTDRPFRMLCRRLGAGLAVSEMMSSNPDLRHTRKSLERADHRGEAGPIAVQIAGADPVQMAQAARLSVERGAEMIDINLGCPAKKVCKAAAGSALLRDEALVGRILESVVRAVDVPVTLKTRTGWSPETRNLSRIGRIAREAGIALITVHGRTRACGYRGEAELESLRRLRHETDLPLVANGDIDSPQKVLAVLKHTGADAIMIGRAAQGRPWIFQEIKEALERDAGIRDGNGAVRSSPVTLPTATWAPPPERVSCIMLEHLDALYHFYGEARGTLIARKHIGWYLCAKGALDAEAMSLRKQLFKAETAREQSTLVQEHFRRMAAE